MRRLTSVRVGPILAALVLAAGCNSQPPKHSEQQLHAPDACKFMLLPKAGLLNATADAKRGNLDAKRKLWLHYSCDDERQATYWQDRLIEANDADALLSRSSTLHLQASRLADNDPHKLILLQQAQAFEVRGRTAQGDGVMHVEINGKEVAVPYSSKPDDYTKRLAREIDRLKSH